MKNYYSDPVIERLASTDSDPTRRLTQLPGTNDPEPVTWTQQPRPSDLEPLAASCPAMYSPSELLCEQPHVLIHTFWVPGITLVGGNKHV
ncbi:uncharacterized [Tachysurus ichikawai]